ncbi:putative membrane-associated metal-dependent hydrolase [Lysobacter silvestris]|uniref:Putative membrane-associated metal-dependent hydrolase n=2 Tax=Solilutibacter silvestris TaxID=1645665 RepID=A0A2K1Q0K7_9GAMM|nr:putative membrane-associated metal-dependent hydrolase [Lysobacter silvestris]
MRANTVLLLCAAWLLAFANFSAWKLLVALDPGRLPHWLFLPCLGVLLAMTILVLLLPLSFKWAIKPWLVIVLLCAGAAAFFMDDFGAVVDRHTLRSVFETNSREAGEWLSWRMAWKIGATGALPALLVLWTRIEWRPFPRELWSRVKLILMVIALSAVAIGIGGRGVASSLRNQRELGHVINPIAIASGLVAYVDNARPQAPIVVQPLGRDATRLPTTAGAKPQVLVFIAGESARAASWGLSGYARQTTPRLAALAAVNFADVRSCGTDTAVSLPCMFSDLGRKDFSERGALARENALDVLTHAGVDVAWFDNNTGDKGVAKRVHETDLQNSSDPAWCSGRNCFDGILVDALKKTLADTHGDRVIVLHVKGSHGPAYYQRYPAEFERFTPVCRSNQLQTCTPEQIRNAYDNSILYTDAVIASVIDTLQGDPAIDGAVLYASDHGESLGESGLYLHGAPYAFAPDVQTHIPMVMWMSAGFRQRDGTDAACVTHQAALPWSHDNIFDALLGMMQVRSSAYRPQLDPLHACRATSAP